MQHKKRLVDPTCLMDAKGRPFTSYEAMEKRIAFLERWIERLVRMLRKQSGDEAPPERPINITLN